MPSLAGAGRLRGWRAAAPGEVLLGLERGAALLAVARDGSVRLRASPDAELLPDPGPAVGREPWRAAAAEPYRRDEGGVALAFEGSEGCVRVEVDADPFALRVLDRAGRTLAWLRALALGPGGAARADLAAPPGARYFGFGEKAGGLDKRGEVLVMRNRDTAGRHDGDPLYVAIPFALELRPPGGGPPGARAGALATGLLLDASAPSRLDVAAGEPERLRLEVLAGGLDLTVFPGPTPADVLRRYTARVGRSPLPPVWALGYHQSRWSYRSEGELRRVARELRRRRLPADALHLDIDHMDGFRVFTWHPRRFPEPRRLLEELRAQGFRVVAIVDPGVKVDGAWSVYRDGLERDVFCRREDGSPFTLRVWPGAAALPDFNRPEVRAWWGEQHRPLLEAGVAGIWNDMNEPAGWSRDLRLGRAVLPIRGQDLRAVVQTDPARPKERVPHEHVRNLYGHQECRATRGALEAFGGGRRPFVLTRSGCAGTGRFAAVWTGDNHSRWRHLRLSLPMLMNLSLSGVPFCGADIGGFAGRPGRELFARWIQLGALYPFARGHSWLFTRQEPWRFGRRVEAIARAALELRMRLLPYLYALFREAEESGAPVWRPLGYEFPDDPVAPAIEDQVLLGPSLLVAPVLERGARTRRLYLPEGAWYAFDDDARYVGPRWVELAAPLERLPLLARGGALLPTRSPVQHAGEPPAEPLVLEVFPGADGRFDVVEDDGESDAYRRGQVARTRLVLRDRAAQRLRLELGAREGPFPVAPRTVRICVHACPPPRAVWLDASRLPPGRGVPGFVAEEGRVQLRLPDDGRAHAIELEPAP
jgi:alpha-glucosidase